MPVYKIIFPVVCFSSKHPLPPLRTRAKRVLVEACEPEHRTPPIENSWADNAQPPPSTGKPFG